MTQNLALSLFMISIGRTDLQEIIRVKKKSDILPGVFSLSFIASSPFTSWVHQSCVTLLWSRDLLWKPLEKALCMWLGIWRAESLLKNPEWMYRRLLIPELSLEPSVGTWGPPAIVVGSLLKPLLSPDPSCMGRRSWRVKHLGKEWGFLCSWQYSPNCGIHCLGAWTRSEWEDTESGWTACCNPGELVWSLTRSGWGY